MTTNFVNGPQSSPTTLFSTRSLFPISRRLFRLRIRERYDEFVGNLLDALFVFVRAGGE